MQMQPPSPPPQPMPPPVNPPVQQSSQNSSSQNQPQTQTTPKPPKKRYLENGEFKGSHILFYFDVILLKISEYIFYMKIFIQFLLKTTQRLLLTLI